jgi:hypothetical protein
MKPMWAVSLLAILLCAAGPPKAAHPPSPRPQGETAPRAVAANEAIADQFAMLAFDADPAVAAMPRTGLARWQEEIRLYVSGEAADIRLGGEIGAALARLTGLPIALVGGGAPNLLVAVSYDPPALFAGPLRRLLASAFNGDDVAVEGFLSGVVATQSCWVLAVWGDTAQTVIKAAVVGIDARQPRAAVERCMAQKLAASLGLLGPAGYLPRSVFAPQTGATRYSLEDGLMLRLLYSPALKPGMSRGAAHDAALAALPGLRHR